MKKIIVLAVSLLLPLMAFAQAQIDTKKIKIGDFTQKVTKVVLTGNMFYDGSLKNEIAAKWRVSPYEFCSAKEFETLKTDDNYYFLMLTQGQFRKEAEPGLMFLTLVKGGEKAAAGIDQMLEVVSLPFASVQEPSGREYVFLPTFLDIIQNYTLDSMDKDINAYIGLSNYSLNISKSGRMTLVFSEGDLSTEVTPKVRNACFDKNVHVLPEEEADKYLTSEDGNTLVSYVAVPTYAKPGSYCYKMLIDPQTNTLYYFRKHKVSRKVGAGFLEEDIRRISLPRKK